MNLSLVGHSYKYELEKLIRIFMPFEKITFSDYAVTEDCSAITELSSDEHITILKSRLIINGKDIAKAKEIQNNCPDYDKECERVLAVLLFECFCETTGYFPDWGILTGVRPAKLFSRLCKEQGTDNTIKYFKDKLKVNEKKISLCHAAVEGEDKITSLSRPESFSLYISVPFCPTRCTYCSFVSHSVERSAKLIPLYVDNLCEELRITGKIAKELKLRLETVYIGGGTPTTLSPEQLITVMKTVADNFDLSNLREYTVEAGRPDTITEDKLLAIKNGGATRISINPQTMNDTVLENIGRRHTSKQTLDAFYLARKCGFDNINMDLIAGLPGDSFESFKDTLIKVCQLNPESVTIHSLSMKRASSLSVNEQFPEIEAGKTAGKMVDFAREYLCDKQIYPYYMYRQSKTVGNLENVGYSKLGYECLYNVYIMDETHSILACGASAVTKLREPGGNYIERIFNYKYPYEYIDRFNELIKRKEGIGKFYGKYSGEH